MQTADIVILVALALPALVGAVYGFLNILFSIIAWALALAISAKFSGLFAPLLEGYVEAPLIRDILAFVGLFVVSLMILTAVGYLVVKLIGRTGLTAADRFLGLLFGIALGGAIIAVIVFLAGFTRLPREPWWRNSILMEPFQRIGVSIEALLPDNVSKYHSYALTLPEPGAGRNE